MSYKVNTLPKHILVSNETEKFLTESILGGSTIDFLSDNGAFAEGQIGSYEPVNIMKTDLIYQDGKICSLQSLGDVALTQTDIYVKPLAFMQSYCKADLWPLWSSEVMRAKKSAKTMDEILFADAIMAGLKEANKEQLERNVWQGKEVAGQAATFNGFLEQLKTGTVDLSTATGTKLYEKIISAFLLMPVAVTNKSDFRVFIGSDLYKQYVAEISVLNLFNQLDPLAVFGTSATFVICDGLADSKKIVFSRARNLQGKGDITSEGTEIESFYVEKEDTMYIRGRFGFGIKPVFVQEIGVLNIA